MLSDMDINAIAGTLKLYFRELPEPLLTDRLYPAFMEGIGEARGPGWAGPPEQQSPEQHVRLWLPLLTACPAPWAQAEWPGGHGVAAGQSRRPDPLSPASPLSSWAVSVLPLGTGTLLGNLVSKEIFPAVGGQGPAPRAKKPGESWSTLETGVLSLPEGSLSRLTRAVGGEEAEGPG